MSYYIRQRPGAGSRGNNDASTIGPSRLEIRDLKNNKEQFALFVHALATIMNPDHRPKAARFVDIAGIHGKPYEQWVGDVHQGLEPPPSGNFGGYCYHGSIFFPTWHRPYLLLLEQSIGDVAKRLATDWTRKSDTATKTQWNDAAKALRFPFWDWTDKRDMISGVPEVLHPQRFTLELPGEAGRPPIQVEIDNPLAFYDFKSRHPDGFENLIRKTPMAPQAISYFKDWDRTYRWPSSKQNPTDDYIKMKEKLAGKQRGSVLLLRDQVSKLFTYPSTVEEGREATTWDEFSNTTFQSKGDTDFPPHGCGSLETPHNTLHLLLGGTGNMSDGDYAGFDPIFYLHHSNIDRILAFWEYVYPKYWMGDGYKKKDGTTGMFTQPSGTWAADEDKPLKQTTPLEPFRKDAKAVIDLEPSRQYWSSNDARLKEILPLYTYPAIDTVKLTITAPTDKEREGYIKKLQKHFSNSNSTQAIHMSDLLKHFPLQNNITVPQGFELISDYRRFVVEVELAFNAFHGSYCLQLVYKGQVVGLSAVFSRGDDTQCAACIGRNKAGLQVRGMIDIPEDVVTEIAKEALEILGGSAASVGSGSVDFVDKIIASFKKSFSARIVGPGDALLAVADLGVRDTAALENNIIPKLRLRSAAGITKKEPDSPVQFFDWSDHGDLLDDSVKWLVG